jgi:AbrB family looped-hinge helix DNA binding protein
MATATISSTFQVVIPEEVRVKLHLTPRQRLLIVEKGSIITLVPEVPLQSLKGCVQGNGDDRCEREKGPRMKTLVDSCGWIEFFTDGPKANHYAEKQISLCKREL